MIAKFPDALKRKDETIREKEAEIKELRDQVEEYRSALERLRLAVSRGDDNTIKKEICSATFHCAYSQGTHRDGTTSIHPAAIGIRAITFRLVPFAKKQRIVGRRIKGVRLSARPQSSRRADQPIARM